MGDSRGVRRRVPYKVEFAASVEAHLRALNRSRKRGTGSRYGQTRLHRGSYAWVNSGSSTR
jgi:hypothetical protein